MADFPFKEIILLILGAISTYLIWRVQYQKERIKTIESQLSDKKFKIYSDLLYLFFDLSKSSKTGDQVTEKELVNRIYDIKAGIFLYTSDEIFIKFTQWVTSLNDPKNAIDHFKIYFELMLLVRKDMGNIKTQLKIDDFMLFYMQNHEEYAKFKKMHGWQ